MNPYRLLGSFNGSFVRLPDADWIELLVAVTFTRLVQPTFWGLGIRAIRALVTVDPTKGTSLRYTSLFVDHELRRAAGTVDGDGHGGGGARVPGRMPQ